VPPNEGDTAWLDHPRSQEHKPTVNTQRRLPARTDADAGAYYRTQISRSGVEPVAMRLAQRARRSAGRRAFSSKRSVTDGDMAVEVVNDYPSSRQPREGHLAPHG
jgi:hypothetical protein